MQMIKTILYLRKFLGSVYGKGTFHKSGITRFIVQWDIGALRYQGSGRLGSSFRKINLELFPLKRVLTHLKGVLEFKNEWFIRQTVGLYRINKIICKLN